MFDFTACSAQVGVAVFSLSPQSNAALFFFFASTGFILGFSIKGSAVTITDVCQFQLESETSPS